MTLSKVGRPSSGPLVRIMSLPRTAAEAKAFVAERRREAREARAARERKQAERARALARLSEFAGQEAARVKAARRGHDSGSAKRSAARLPQKSAQASPTPARALTRISTAKEQRIDIDAVYRSRNSCRAHVQGRTHGHVLDFGPRGGVDGIYDRRNGLGGAA